MRAKLPERLLRFLAPALLVVVACVQLVLVRAHDLTAWKGGGFGMFSTFDGVKSRAYRVSVLTDAGEAIVVEPNLRVRRERLLYMPSDGVLQTQADHTAAESWMIFDHDQALAMRELLPEEMRRQIQRAALRRRKAWLSDSTAALPDPYPSLIAFQRRSQPVRFTEVETTVRGARVEVWRLVFDPDSRTLSGEVINRADALLP